MLGLTFLSLGGDVRLALTLFFFIMIMNWARASMSPKLSLFFAGVITYLTFWQHPSLVWLGLLVFLAGTGVITSFLKAIEGIK